MKNTVTQPRILAKIPSHSNPAKSYEIRLGGDGVVYCTCRAWITNKFCKHLEEYHDKNTAMTKLETFQNQSNVITQFFEKQAQENKQEIKGDKIYLTVANGIMRGVWE